MKNLNFKSITNFKYFRFQKNKLTTKKIINISIFSAASVAIIVILFSYTPILVFPTAKIAFEGVFIKIVGYLFGPFCGMTIGLVTEILVNLIRPTFVHWVFFVTMIAYGFVGGIGNYLNKSFGYRLKFILFIFLIAILIALYVFLWVYYRQHGLDLHNSFIEKIFKSGVLSVFLVVSVIFIAVIFMLVFILHCLKKYELVDKLIPIIIFSAILDFGIGNFLISFADKSLLNVDYSVLLFLKFFISPIIFLFNIAIIYTVTTVLQKIIKNHD